MKLTILMDSWLKPAQLAVTMALLALTSLSPALAQDASTEAVSGVVIAAAPEATEIADAPIPLETPTSTLERIRATGAIRLGYRMDAQPFSYQNASGQAAGYTVSLCSKVADQVKAELALSALAVEWVPVTLESRFDDLAGGSIDLLCGADTASLSRRQQVSFSIPIFPGGIGALVRTDAPTRLQLVLEGRPLPNQPLWRGNPAQVLQHKNFSAVSGSTAETWLTGRITMLGILAAAVSVDSYEAGLERVLNRSSDALFGDRAILLEAAARNPAARNLRVLDRLFTVEPVALGVARGDEDFRLLVDRTLSGLYGSSEFGELYTEIFGEPDERALLFFLTNSLPE